MSALSASFTKYKSELADTAARNAQYARPSSSAPPPPPPRSSTPKPPASTEKRTQDAALPAHASASSGVGSAGRELMTHVWNAVAYLKTKNLQPVPFDQLLSYLSLPLDLQKNVPLIKRALQGNERVVYLGKNESGSGKESFRYRSLHPVTNGEELVAYLSKMDSSQGLSVREIRDGWPDCTSTIDRLEREGQILVTRKKKDNTPQFVWADSPSCYPVTNPVNHAVSRVDPDFVDFWAKTKLPASEGEIRSELERAGITVTSAVKEVRRDIGKKKERKRVQRKGARTTNNHMIGILKDYSNRKVG